MSDRDLAASVSATIRDAVVDVVEREVPLAVAIARATAALIDGSNSGLHRERPAERHRRENTAALAQMIEIEQSGDRRGAAMIVARRMAVDRHDPAEVEIIAQRLRRMRRMKLNEQCSFAAETEE